MVYLYGWVVYHYNLEWGHAQAIFNSFFLFKTYGFHEDGMYWPENFILLKNKVYHVTNTSASIILSKKGRFLWVQTDT